MKTFSPLLNITFVFRLFMVRDFQFSLHLSSHYMISIPKDLRGFVCYHNYKYLQKTLKLQKLHYICIMKKKIYLDDVRTPIDKEDWVIVRNYDEFVDKVSEIGLDNIELISLDHDLGDTAMAEWHKNVYHNYELNYDNITEKTGMDCTKWLVEKWMDGAPVVDVYIHSANAIGSANMMGYINNYRHINHLRQSCVRVQWSHTVE